MASIEEHEMSMTIFYYKSDGDIYSYSTGISDMSIFGKRQDEYSLIIDFIVCPIDKTILGLLNHFCVNIETKQLKLKDENIDLSKYK
jgi:hypothetical protein